MKKWEKGLTFIISAALLSACSSSASSSVVNSAAVTNLTDGTYTATAQGMDGDVTVETVIRDNAIESITITSDEETAGVGEKAVQMMAETITDAQTTKVDSITGATISSNAVRNAVRDCIEQAGGTDDDLNTAPVVEAGDSSYDTDVVVVGAGIAGLAAAAEAHDAGAEVILVEKAGIPGGTGVFSSGNMLASETHDDDASVADTWNERNKLQERNQVDMDKVNALVAASVDTLALFKKAGVEYELRDGMFRPAASERSKENAENIKLATASVSAKGGAYLVDTLEEYLQNEGVTVLYNTTATELITENGTVKGIRAEDKAGTVTINAKSVILATGDYARNDDLTAELAPDATENYPATIVTADGSGIEMAVKAGAVKADFGESMSGCFAPDPYDMPVVGEPNNSYPFEVMLLTLDGERVVKEDAGVHTQMVYFTRAGVPDAGWVVFDEEVAQKFLNLDQYLEETADGSSYIEAYKESDIASLAEDMDLDADVLQASIDKYNAQCAAGEDELGKDPQYLSAIDDGTYYAVKEYDMTRGNYGGIETNVRAEVTDKDGNAIPGLYAAGIISSADYFGDYYPGREALAVGSYNGYISGQNAAAYAAQ